MSLNSIGSTLSMVLCCSLLSPGFTFAQVTGQEAAQPNAAVQKYKLTILESPSTSKRVKKGRVSAEAVIKVTDTNNIPVPGITVTFLLPQYGTGGAAFSTGALSSVVTTNAAGVATSGSLTAATGSSVSVSVSAAVPGGVLTGTVPVSTAAVAGAAGAAGAGAAAGGASAGISTGLIVGIAAVVVAGGLAAAAASGAFSSKSGTTPPPPVTVTIGSPASGGITFGPPK